MNEWYVILTSRVQNWNTFSTVYLFSNFGNFNFCTCEVLVVPMKIIRKRGSWERAVEAPWAAQRLWGRRGKESAEPGSALSNRGSSGLGAEQGWQGQHQVADLTQQHGQRGANKGLFCSIICCSAKSACWCLIRNVHRNHPEKLLASKALNGPITLESLPVIVKSTRAPKVKENRREVLQWKKLSRERNAMRDSDLDSSATKTHHGDKGRYLNGV